MRNPIKQTETEWEGLRNQGQPQVDGLSAAPAIRTDSEGMAQEPSSWSKQVTVLIFFSLLAVFLVSVLYDPGDKDPYASYSTICMFKNATGVPCPGCGLTHSFCEIGKGNLASAFAWNWLGIPVFLFAILVWIKSVFLLGGWKKPARALDQAAAWLRPLRLFAIAFALYGVGRIIYILFFLPSAKTSHLLSQVANWLVG